MYLASESQQEVHDDVDVLLVEGLPRVGLEPGGGGGGGGRGGGGGGGGGLGARPPRVERLAGLAPALVRGHALQSAPGGRRHLHATITSSKHASRYYQPVLAL